MSMIFDLRFWFVIFILICLFYITVIPISQSNIQPVVIGTFVDHANLKHGTDADIVKNCIDKQGADVVYNKVFDKKVQLCLMAEGLGIQVSCKKESAMCRITGYIDRTIKSVEEMIAFAEEDMGQYGHWSYAKDYIKAMFEIKY